MEVSCLEEEMEQSGRGRTRWGSHQPLCHHPSLDFITQSQPFGESGQPFTSDPGVSSAPSLANF